MIPSHRTIVLFEMLLIHPCTDWHVFDTCHTYNVADILTKDKTWTHVLKRQIDKYVKDNVVTLNRIGALRESKDYVVKGGVRLMLRDGQFRQNLTPFLCFGNSFWT